MTNFKNYKNETFTECPHEIIGCNFEKCTFSGCGDTTFVKCNLKECVFMEQTSFLKSNIIYTEETKLPDGCNLVKSNYIDKIEIKEYENKNDANASEQPTIES